MSLKRLVPAVAAKAVSHCGSSSCPYVQQTVKDYWQFRKNVENEEIKVV
jgi:hypothetical protein